jgi:hypothetical protein
MALKATPFVVVYGRARPALLLILPGATSVEVVDRQLCDHDTFLTEVRDWLLQAQGIMMVAHDKHHRQLEFIVDDWAWLRLNQRVTVSVREGLLSKLAPKYFRPYPAR